MSNAPSPRWYQRYFAWLMHRVARRYDAQFGSRKRALLGDLTGTVVEIGPGTGPNLAYYRDDVRWIGIEPNPGMHRYLEREAERLGRAIDLRRGKAHRLELEDGCADAVVSTLVLCSVGSLPETLNEIRRVLKPGGTLVFLEHVVAPPDTWLRRVQNWIAPLWRRLNDNCHPNRDIAGAVERAGFVQVQVDRFAGPLPVPVVRPHVAGRASKPAR